MSVTSPGIRHFFVKVPVAMLMMLPSLVLAPQSEVIAQSHSASVKLLILLSEAKERICCAACLGSVVYQLPIHLSSTLHYST
jgi:hypothetical protein